VSPWVIPLLLYECSLLVAYVVGRLAGWWGGDVMAVLGVGGMVTVCALPMLWLWSLARKTPESRRPALRAAAIAAGVAILAGLVVSANLDAVDADARTRFVVASLSPAVAAAVLLAAPRRRIAVAGFLLGCYTLPAALAAAAVSQIA